MIRRIRDCGLVVGSTVLVIGLATYGIARGAAKKIYSVMLEIGEARYQSLRQRGYRYY